MDSEAEDGPHARDRYVSLPLPRHMPDKWHSRVLGGFRSMECFNRWDV